MIHSDSSQPSSAALPTFSVVIPAYNEEAVIDECLTALFHQAVDIESVIVVDNNSTDTTAAIVREFSKRWPIVQLVQESSPGVVSARNAGLNAAKSDIIARIDADTIVMEGWAKAYRCFFADAAHASVGASTGTAIPYDMPFPKLTEFIYDVFIIQSNRLISKGDTLFGTNMAIRRDAWHAISDQTCRRASIMEDLDIGLHLRQRGYLVKTAPAARVAFSARRMLTSPLQYFRYSHMWPATYWHHGMKVIAILTWPLMVLGVVLQTLAWPLMRSYDPMRRRFSLRRLFSRQVTREIPKGH